MAAALLPNRGGKDVGYSVIPQIRKGSPANRDVNVTKRAKTLQALRYCPVVLSANGRIRPGPGSGQWQGGAPPGRCLLPQMAGGNKKNPTLRRERSGDCDRAPDAAKRFLPRRNG